MPSSSQASDNESKAAVATRAGNLTGADKAAILTAAQANMEK